MSNEIYDKDKKEVKFENKHFNKKISILAGIIVFAVIVSFFGAYIISDRLINPKYSQEKEEDEKTVYNNSKILNDDMMVVLMNEGVVEKEQSILEFKKENSIVSDINQQFVVNFYEANGYNLESLEDDKVVFIKEGTTSVLQPNKYYLGEKDGYFAIYKTDDSGNLTIEESEDIYSNNRPISFLQGDDLDAIKNFKYSYDTKEEAIEKLSAFIS